jgi:hypothetical protein
MARILICEPVNETRELMERLVRRMGHEVVDLDSLRTVDVLLFEPDSRDGQAIARLLGDVRPAAKLVACHATPPAPALRLPRLFATLLQPFSPTDLRRVVEAALRPAPAA